VPVSTAKRTGDGIVLDAQKSWVTSASDTRGICRDCRHANQNTEDADDGFSACPWIGANDPLDHCLIKYTKTGEYVFEYYDGTNCTWDTSAVFRSIPKGYEEKEVVLAETNPP
jgi:hypothetical protein